MRKSVVNQSEIAFKAYIAGIIAGTITPPPENPTANTTLAGTLPAFPMNLYAYQQVYGVTNPNPGQTMTVENVIQPAIIFKADQPKQIAYDCGIYDMKFFAQIETQIDDEQLPNQVALAQDTHHARVEALRDCLEDFAQVSEFVNYPFNQATVPYFTLSSILFIDELEELKDRRFVTLISYEIEACPADPYGDN